MQRVLLNIPVVAILIVIFVMISNPLGAENAIYAFFFTLWFYMYFGKTDPLKLSKSSGKESENAWEEMILNINRLGTTLIYLFCIVFITFLTSSFVIPYLVPEY